MAVVEPHLNGIRQWCHEHKLPLDPAVLSKSTELRDFILADFERVAVLNGLPAYQIPRGLIMVSSEF